MPNKYNAWFSFVMDRYVLPNSYYEALTTNVIVFGGRALERALGLDELKRAGSYDGMSIFIRRRGTSALRE